GRDRRPRAQRFDATSLAAIALRATVVDGNVSSLGGTAGAAVIDGAVEHDPGADAGAQGRVKNIAVTNAGTPERFRQSGGIGVIVDARSHTERALGLGGEGEIAPAGYVRRIQHDTRLWIERARRADADAFHHTALVEQRGDRLADCRKSPGCI